MSRLLIYVMLPLLIICTLISTRFVSWDSLKGENPDAFRAAAEGTALLQRPGGNYQQAADAFTRAIEKDPKYAAAYIKRGLAYYRLEAYPKAIADYTQTLDLRRYTADAYYSRGYVHRALCDYQKAIADYTASLKKRWAGFVTWKKVEVYLEMGDTQRALMDYAAVIERKPNAAAYYYRGKAYRRLDENQLALDDFAKVRRGVSESWRNL